VHVLAADQDGLSARFARRGIDKFAGLDVEIGVGNVPLLRGCMARFQCETAFEYMGGDHVIFVGKVLAFDRSEHAPLVFHGGKYAHAAKRDVATESALGSGYLAGSFNEDFLGYLLGRGHFQFFRQLRPHLSKEGLSDEEFYVLSTLTLKRAMSSKELDAAMKGVLDERATAAVQSLIQRGLAREAPVVAEADWTEYELTEDGRAMALRLIAVAKSVESQLEEHLGRGESAALKSLLHRLLTTLDPAAVALWGGGRGHGKTKTSGTGWHE
jgi:3-hydroxy-9,10-secoandrosta-1,3,5(10)-triene-9,17-dione monooxygenase reductase component